MTKFNESYRIFLLNKTTHTLNGRQHFTLSFRSLVMQMLAS
ncbi:hypothetical protein ACFOGG_14145 [Brenneria rubrifaciens]